TVQYSRPDGGTNACVFFLIRMNRSERRHVRHIHQENSMKTPFITLAAIISLGGFASIAAAQNSSGTTGSADVPAMHQEGQTGTGTTTGATGSTGTTGSSSGQQLTQAECQQLWSTAAGSSQTLSQSQAQDYTQNFSQVDANA